MRNSPVFFVAQGSSVNPSDLKHAGFVMQNFGFYPSNFEEVCKKMADFQVTNESVGSKKVYRINKK
ncbi:TPA: hypothetical protein P7L52_003263 [Vibrio cholerae]|nr:hypothetical protein [Vibrio cholerae]HDP8701216.1 hypothetical protein [Vibrio cholerae]